MLQTYKPREFYIVHASTDIFQVGYAGAPRLRHLWWRVWLLVDALLVR
jgi:hypothetical protein